MPIYEFCCNNCNTTFELLVRTSTVLACPNCASMQLEKMVSLPSPPGKTTNILKRARAQAAREGHFSNYKPSELKR